NSSDTSSPTARLRQGLSELPDHVSHRAGDDLRKVISQTIDLACDGVEFLVEVIEPRMHVKLDISELAGDEAELSFELREPRLGEIDATLQVSELFFQIDSHGRTSRRFMSAIQQIAGRPNWGVRSCVPQHAAVHWPILRPGCSLKPHQTAGAPLQGGGELL